MSKVCNDDELIRMCQTLDEVEADLRGLESRLNAFRMRLRESVSKPRQRECGFVPSDDDGQTLRPHPRFANSNAR